MCAQFFCSSPSTVYECLWLQVVCALLQGVAQLIQQGGKLLQGVMQLIQQGGKLLQGVAQLIQQGGKLLQGVMQFNKVGNCFRGTYVKCSFFLSTGWHFCPSENDWFILHQLSKYNLIQFSLHALLMVHAYAGKIEPSWTFLWCVPESVKAVWHWPMGTTLSQSLWNTHALTLLHPSHKYEANAYTHNNTTQIWHI